MTTSKKKAFSMVELVVVILIIAVLAVAVFAGGSAAIKKSQVARTTSDLHNFSIAAETTLTSTPSVANITNNSMGDGGMAKVVNEFNDLLAADYKLTSLTPLTSADLGNIQIVADTADTGAYAIFQSSKTDAWDNPYYVIFDSTERHDGTSDFTITVVSAGSNAQTKVGGEIEKDDVFMLAETSDSSVASVILKASDIGDVQCPLGARKIVGNSASSNAAATYAGVTGFTTSATESVSSVPTSTPSTPSTPDPEPDPEPDPVTPASYTVTNTTDSTVMFTVTHTDVIVETKKRVTLTATKKSKFAVFGGWNITGSYTIVSGSLNTTTLVIDIDSDVTVAATSAISIEPAPTHSGGSN